MDQGMIDERTGKLYGECPSPLSKRLGKFRIEMHVLEEQYDSDPESLDEKQLRRLSSLNKSLGRLKIEMGLLVPLSFYGYSQLMMGQPDSVLEKALFYGGMGTMCLVGGLFAYLSKYPFGKARLIDDYRKNAFPKPAEPFRL